MSLENRLISTATTLNDRLDDVKPGVLSKHAFALQSVHMVSNES